MTQNLAAEFTAIREASGFLPLPHRALLRATGADSTRWLNGMVTNSVTALSPGEGAYSFLLNAQGRIQGDCTVYRETGVEPAYLLSTTAAQAEELQPWLDRYIIMDEVELTQPEDHEQSLLILGPDTVGQLGALGLPMPDPLRLLRADCESGHVLLLTPPPGLVPRVELRGSAAMVNVLQEKLAYAGVFGLSPGAVEAWRVFEGVPLFGTDIRDRDLPQETGQTHALHFNKGCYLGQEIVERIRSRGQVHRTLTRFALLGALPDALPAPLVANGKSAGELTSAVKIPSDRGGDLMALGYVRRESLATKAELTYANGTASAIEGPHPST